ncbi:hypothetical protein [Clostridium sp. JNZ J1-5]|nr:hypothetical protein [Clostridium sp.]
MVDKEIKILLLKEELNEFIECMKYQYGENYKEYSEVAARIEVIENMIKIVSQQD